jgi:hypothetical protein
MSIKKGGKGKKSKTDSGKGKKPPYPPSNSKTGTDNSEKSYEVGYQKPPKHTQYPKGTSGNPKGRRKGSHSLRRLIYEYAEESLTLTMGQGSISVSALQAASKKFWEAMLKKGDIRFFKEYFSIEAEMEAKIAQREAWKLNPLIEMQRKLFLILSGKAEGMTEEEIEEYLTQHPEDDF